MARATPSAIDPEVPEQGNATTESVRANFLAARDEINDLFGHIDRIDTAAAAETTRVDAAIAHETTRTDLQFGAEQTRVNTQFTNEQARVNTQHSNEQTRVNDALDARAMRAGDLGGTIALTTVLRLQNYPVLNVPPVNTPRPAARKVLGWNGTDWAPDDVRQIQSWPIATTNPSIGQALKFNGASGEWEPSAAAGTPDRIIWLAMPNDVHSWIPVGTEGWYASERDSAGLTNAPAAGFFFYRAWSSTSGRIRIEALQYDSVTGLAYVKSRNTGGVWSAWTNPSM